MAWSRLTFALVGDLSLADNVDGPGECLVADIAVGGSVVRDLYKLVTTDVYRCLLGSSNMSSVVNYMSMYV